MNRIFYWIMLLAFLAGAWAQLTWTPPPPAPTPPPPVATTYADPELAALAAQVDALKAKVDPPKKVEPPSPPIKSLQDAILSKARAAVDLVIGLIGATAFFLGLMKVAEEGGMLQVIARLIRPLMVRLFPEVPPNHPAMAAMILNMSANALGLGNAATPFGLKAMAELDKLNPNKGTASNAMVLFLAINTSGVTLLPTGVIVLRETMGSHHAAAILPTTLFATSCSTLTAITMTFLLVRFFPSAAAVTPPDEIVALPADDGASEDDAAYPAWASFLALGGLLAAIPAAVLWGDLVAPWIVPLLTIGFLTFGHLRGVPVYEAFIRGAKDGWDIAVRIVPYLVAILTAVGMFTASGAMATMVRILDPITGPLGLPGAALPMALIRPLSGSGATGVLVGTMQDPATGPDTYTGFLVSTISGSTETTFYVLAVYFGSVGIRRFRHALPAALAADLAGVVGAVVAVKLLFTFSPPM